ncbi:hypothetical protein BASA81_012649 [Batrachochytrium salamandrivorans]|nr:hypothetical protein BASA81_012649 [Batrachochytrium salamandrivorans]
MWPGNKWSRALVSRRLLDAERVANPDNDEEYVLVDFSLIPGWQMVTGLVSLVGETCLLPDANNDNRLGIRPRLLLNHFQVDYAALRATVEKRRKFLL